MSSPRAEKRMLVLEFSGFGTKARPKGEKATEPEKERNGDAREKRSKLGSGFFFFRCPALAGHSSLSDERRKRGSFKR